MGKNYRKVKNSALSGFGREIGKNTGKVLSNYLFGDNHSTPIKLIREKEKRKLMKFKAQAEEKKLQGKKELLELKHQQALEQLAEKERIKQDSLDEKEEALRLEDLKSQQNKDSIEDFSNYINSITALQKTTFEEQNWNEILTRKFKAHVINNGLISKLNNDLISDSSDSEMLDISLRLSELELDVKDSDKNEVISSLLDLTSSNNSITVSGYKSTIDDIFCNHKYFFSVFDELAFDSAKQMKAFSKGFEIDIGETPVSIGGIEDIEKKAFQGLYNDDEKIISFDEKDPFKIVEMVNILENHSLVSFRLACDLCFTVDDVKTGLSMKEKMFGIKDETLGKYRKVHEDISSELGKLRAKLIAYYNYIVEARKYIRGDKFKEDLTNYNSTYQDYFRLEKELKIYAAKLIESQRDKNKQDTTVSYLLDSEAGILDYFSNISDLCPETSFAYNGNSMDIQITIKDKSEVIPIEEPRLIRGKEIKMDNVSEKQSNDWFQDYVCGLSLRICGELFSVIPFLESSNVIVNTTVLNSSTGNYNISPILALNANRDTFQKLNLNRLDASDCLENIFKATMKWNSKNGFLEIPLSLDPPNEEPLSAENSSAAGSMEQNKTIGKGVEIDRANEKLIGLTFKTDGTRKRTFTLCIEEGYLIGEYSKGVLKGKLTDETLTGSFTDSEIAPEGGTFEFKFDHELSHFEGNWKTDTGEAELKGQWNGKRQH